MSKEKEPFLSIPDSVLYIDPSKLTWLEKVIVSYRLSYGDKFYASNEHVAEQFFTTKKTVCVAYQKARDCGILPPEQILMDTIITQSGSYGKVTNDYGKVTGSYANDYGKVTNDYGKVTNDYGKVTGSYGKVTDELLYGNQKEAVSPMKNDLLLDQCIRTINKNSSIKPVILPKSGIDDLIENMSKDSETIDVKETIETDDVIKSSHTSVSKITQTESNDVIVKRRKVIKHAISKRGIKPHTAYGEDKKKIGFVYAEQPFKNYSFGISKSDYDISATEMEKTV